jgi:DNA topoisomerase VI subunit B
MSTTLNRTVFSTSRLLDFFSEKELTAQVGHGKADWPLVLVKELLDNSIDAAEDAGVAPDVVVKVDKTAITSMDNGPGIPPETVARILDFAVRVSSREAYVWPTRGAQGNALKTIIAMPFVLDRKQGRISISSRGIRHEITIRVDPIRQQPVIDRQEVLDPQAETGTSVVVQWPDSASSILANAKSRFLQIADDYTLLNPHLTLMLDWCGQSSKIKATNASWKKWLPSDPTSPHWYTAERFDRLISPYLAHDADAGRERTIREFIAEFDGLTGTAKQKTVLDQLALHRVGLSGLRKGEGLDHERTSVLLGAMRAITRPVKPATLGVIGKQHLQERFTALGCEIDTFQYRKVVGETDGLPEVLETAFAWRGDVDADRRLITGVNWSPGIVNPFRQLGKVGQSLDSILQQQRAGHEEPVIILLHLTCPRVSYTDRGKSAIAFNTDEHAEEDQVVYIDDMRGRRASGRPL